jgi:hypothetical protein
MTINAPPLFEVSPLSDAVADFSDAQVVLPPPQNPLRDGVLRQCDDLAEPRDPRVVAALRLQDLDRPRSGISVSTWIRCDEKISISLPKNPGNQVFGGLARRDNSATPRRGQGERVGDWIRPWGGVPPPTRPFAASVAHAGAAGA